MFERRTLLHVLLVAIVAGWLWADRSLHGRGTIPWQIALGTIAVFWIGFAYGRTAADRQVAYGPGCAIVAGGVFGLLGLLAGAVLESLRGTASPATLAVHCGFGVVAGLVIGLTSSAQAPTR